MHPSPHPDARVLGSDAARAVGRFNPHGPTGYRARSGGPLRATRAEAEADEAARTTPDPRDYAATALVLAAVTMLAVQVAVIVALA